MKKFTKEEIIKLYGQVTIGEMSFSQMTEVLNQRISEAEDMSDELEKGDLAIFWDNDKEFAFIRRYDGLNDSYGYYEHTDSVGSNWTNAIKFESKEQYERLIKGEI